LNDEEKDKIKMDSRFRGNDENKGKAVDFGLRWDNERKVKALDSRFRGNDERRSKRRWIPACAGMTSESQNEFSRSRA
jgi:hypothetical protein